MSTRNRIVRAIVVALIVLGMGSIGTAAAFAAQAIDTNSTPADVQSDAQGELGVGEQTSAALSGPVSGDDKVSHPVPLAIAGALVVPAAKVSTPVPKPVSAKRTSKRSVSRARSSVRARLFGRGWQRARVSWYGPGFYGNTMAGGGKLMRDSMVVAHRSMPFGTRIEFAYHGKKCIAVVRDRGPYVAGRVFDLGPGTARALGFSGVGVVSYRILGR